MSSWASRVKEAAGAPAKLALSEGLPIFAGIRTVQECLCGAGGSNGSVSAPCKLTLFTEGGRVKVAINDVVGGRVAFVTLVNELPLGAGLEQALSEAILEWRPAKTGSNGRFGASNR